MSRIEITNHHDLRTETNIDCSSPILTDQSYKNLCDVNVIMANYAKTGMLSHTTTEQPRYVDNTTVPDLANAFRIVQIAQDMFYDLPGDIRKLMDNDPSQLESFIQNPANTDMLIKHGIIYKQETKIDIPPITTKEA